MTCRRLLAFFVPARARVARGSAPRGEWATATAARRGPARRQSARLTTVRSLTTLRYKVKRDVDRCEVDDDREAARAARAERVGAPPVRAGAHEHVTSDFVHPDSIVRRIWGNGEMVLLVFAGSAAEFALNRAVDWLFFTGRLPGDPIGRLFTTAGYAQHIVFADERTAARTLDGIRAAHVAVERRRGERIPDWAHRDVLYMLIDYSERAHALLARPLTAEEQQELYDVFRRVGHGLGIPDLPATYAEWLSDRRLHLRRDLLYGKGTAALYAQYRRHLGAWRYRLLLRLQSILVPDHVRALLQLEASRWLRPLARLYPALVGAGLIPLVRRLLVPAEHRAAVRRLDQRGSGRLTVGRPAGTHVQLQGG